jgi:hypothetical protein
VDEESEGPLIGAGVHQIGQEIAGLKRGRVTARARHTREFWPEEDDGDMACTRAPPVNEKRKEEGNTGSGGRMLCRGPFLVPGRNVADGLLLLFLYLFPFSFLILFVNFAKRPQIDFNQKQNF